MSALPASLHALTRAEARRQRGRLAAAAAAAAGAAAAGALLLGLSGWFLAAAAIAGGSGTVAAAAFNYLLPSAAIRGLAIARTGLRYAERLTGHAAALHALAKIRPALFAGLAAAPAERALALSSGEAVSRLVDDVSAIEGLFVRKSAPWAALAPAVAAGLLTALVSVWAAVAFVAGFAILIAAGAGLSRVRSRRAGETAPRTMGALKAGVAAFAAAATELRCYGFVDEAVASLAPAEAAANAARRSASDAAADLGGLQPLATGATVAAVLGLCAGSPPPLAALAALACAVAMEGAASLLQAFERNGAIEAAAARLDEIIAAPSADGARDGRALAPALVIRWGARTWRLAPGARRVIPGPSGAGKTRLLATLVGLDAAPGVGIAVGGVPIDTLPLAQRRALFAYAPQNADMISGTVRENLALANPTAGDAEMMAILATAQLAERVRAMPEGLDSWIGEGGRLLSGGERRRLAVARALLRLAPWLLLDEPTEGLDAATETRLVAALSEHLDRSGQGLILVSHRPSPLSLCPAEAPPAPSRGFAIA